MDGAHLTQVPAPSPAASPAGSCHAPVFTMSPEPFHGLTPQKSENEPISFLWDLSLGPIRIPDPKSEGCLQLPAHSHKEKQGEDDSLASSFCSRPLVEASPSAEALQIPAGGSAQALGTPRDTPACCTAP